MSYNWLPDKLHTNSITGRAEQAAEQSRAESSNATQLNTQRHVISCTQESGRGRGRESGTLCVVECFLIEPVTLPSPIYIYIFLVVRGLTRNSVQFHAVNVTYPNKLSLIRANIKHARLLYKQRISNSSMTSSFGQTHTHTEKNENLLLHKERIIILCAYLMGDMCSSFACVHCE